MLLDAAATSASRSAQAVPCVRKTDMVIDARQQDDNTCKTALCAGLRIR